MKSDQINIFAVPVPVFLLSSDFSSFLNFDLLASQSSRFIVIWFEFVVVIGRYHGLSVGFGE